jgi:LmbE family N-acetylglucosaminyl deacetylase
VIRQVKHPRVLAIGAHPDDIELGAAGTIWRLTEEYAATVTYLIMTAGVRSWESGGPFVSADRRKEAEASGKLLRVHHVRVLDLIDSELQNYEHECIRHIERFLYRNPASNEANFDLIFTHSRADTHSDHRHTFHATISAARYFYGTIVQYQTPSTIPNDFRPTYFVSLDKEAIAKKVAALQVHQSQQRKEFLQEEYVKGMAHSWALFHRMPMDTAVEAFELYQGFWPLGPKSARAGKEDR